MHEFNKQAFTRLEKVTGGAPNPTISAYVPVFNNSATVEAAIDSLWAQSIPPAGVLVVDDGSTDDSARRARTKASRLISLECNRGRGAARARAMEEAQHELVVCCDGTNVLSNDFTAKALPFFEEHRVAAVFGKLEQPPPMTVAERWRGRHLLKTNQECSLRRGASLATWGTMLRKSAVLQVGNFDSDLRHSEDADLGERLLQSGYDVIYDPSLKATSVGYNTVRDVLERYWRWHAGKDMSVSISAYLGQVLYSGKVMASRDFKAGDPLSAAISLCSPHYQLWRSLTAHRSRGANR